MRDLLETIGELYAEVRLLRQRVEPTPAPMVDADWLQKMHATLQQEETPNADSE